MVTTQVLENATAPKDWDRGQNTTWRDRTVFYDPVRDQGARWQGALHVRSQPPKFESWPCASRPGKPCAGPKAAVQAEYDAYFRTMASSELWRCAAEHAAAVASEMPGGGPAKLFLATDRAEIARRDREVGKARVLDHATARPWTVRQTWSRTW